MLTTNLSTSTSLFRTTSERDRSTLVQIGKLSFVSKHNSLTHRHIQIQGVTAVDKRGGAIRIKSNVHSNTYAEYFNLNSIIIIYNKYRKIEFEDTLPTKAGINQTFLWCMRDKELFYLKQARIKMT